jgi:hypothetical protein
LQAGWTANFTESCQPIARADKRGGLFPKTGIAFVPEPSALNRWRSNSRFLFAGALALIAAAARGEDVRYFEEGGVTYRETRVNVGQATAMTGQQPANQIAYAEQLHTEYQSTIRVYSVPVTEYRSETYWVGRWNPFSQPYQAQRMVPVTRWQTRTEVVQVPVTRRELVAQTQAPPTTALVQQGAGQTLVTRVVVSSQAAKQPTMASHQAAPSSPIGGASPLSQWPGAVANDADWRPAGTIATRPATGALWR